MEEPVQFTGWKSFYLHDNEKGVMPTASDLMRLFPLRLYCTAVSGHPERFR